MLLESDQGLGRRLEGHDIDGWHRFADVGLLGTSLDGHDLLAGKLRQRRDAAIPPHHDLLTGDEGGQRKRDDCFALPRVCQGRG